MKAWRLPQSNLRNHSAIISTGKASVVALEARQRSEVSELNISELSTRCHYHSCSEAFAPASSMKNHTARVHHHQCDHPDCGKCFNKKYQLKAHKLEHQELLPFRCSISGCNKEFPSRGKLKHHEKVHEGYSCQVQECPFHAVTWTEYLKHVKSHKGKLACTKCTRQFSNDWFLHQHMQFVHSGEKRLLSCPREGCDKKFTRRFHLESHIQKDHEGKTPFVCSYTGCGKSFAMMESLWRHRVVHDPEKKKMKKPHPNMLGLKTIGDQMESELATKLCETTLEDNKS